MLLKLSAIKDLETRGKGFSHFLGVARKLMSLASWNRQCDQFELVAIPMIIHNEECSLQGPETDWI